MDFRVDPVVSVLEGDSLRDLEDDLVGDLMGDCERWPDLREGVVKESWGVPKPYCNPTNGRLGVDGGPSVALDRLLVVIPYPVS